MASRWKPGWDDLALILLTLTGMGFVCAHGFIHLDDPAYVFANPMVQDGLSIPGIWWAFTNLSVGMWLPMTWLSLQLDATLFGPGKPISALDWNNYAWGFHLTNLILHTINVVLLYRLLRGVTGARGRSFVVAALFAIHPLHVESVAWVTERKDVLSGLFFLLTLLAYDRFVKHRNWSSYLLVLLCFLAALGSKPMVVTLPFVLLLWDYWPLGRLSWGVVLEKVPLFLMALAICVVTFLEHRRFGAMGSTPWTERGALACVSYGFHLWKTFWPTGLAMLYPRRHWDWLDWQVLTCLALLIGVTVLVLRQWRAQPYVVVGWLWFVGVLLPVSGLSQVGTANMNDRFTYLPHIGLFIMLVWLLSDWFDRLGVDRATRVISSMAVLGVLLVMTMKQVGYWHDTPTLLVHSIRVTEKNGTVYRTLAGYYLDAGELDLAESLAREALHNTNDGGFHIILGVVAVKRGNAELALQHLRAADDLDLHDPLVSMQLAYGYRELNMPEDVIRHCDRFLRYSPRDSRALSFKDEALKKLKQTGK